MVFPIYRYFDFAPGTKIQSGQVDTEFNQLIEACNQLANNINTDKTTLAGSEGAALVGITNVTGLSPEVTTVQQFVANEVTERLAHVNNTTNPHNVTKAQVGLENVDNTSDVNKPVSTATRTELDKKVDKITGKGLSSFDYTGEERTKLSNIQANAQVNQNAFSKIKIGNITVESANQTDTVELIPGANITIGNLGKQITITASGILKDQNTQREVKVWYGTLAEYNNLTYIDDDTDYNILEGV